MKKLLLISTILASFIIPLSAFAQSTSNCQQLYGPNFVFDGTQCIKSSPGNQATGAAGSGSTGSTATGGPVSCGTPGANSATCIPTGTAATTGPVSCSTPGSNPSTCIPSGPATVPATAQAQQTAPAQTGTNLGYTPLEPIPGITTGTGGFDVTNPANLPLIIDAVFKILITVGALFAVLNLTIGGIQYMTAEAVDNKKGGITRAQNAMKGILLIAMSWLILNTINPNLLKFTFAPPCTGSGCVVNSAPAQNSNLYTGSVGTQTLDTSSQNLLKVDQANCTIVKNTTSVSGILSSWSSFVYAARSTAAQTFTSLTTAQAEQLDQNFLAACAQNGFI